MAFRGWKPQAIEFYEGLEADNSKTYWQAHKADYDALVLRPMEELLDELAPEFGEGRIFRPYRDVRFSADKSPYKTNIAAGMGGVGYLQLSADGLMAGSGYWMMAADQLERYRAAVAGDRTGAALDKITAAARKAGLQVTAHESLKSAPRGYPKDHPRLALLRQKGVVMSKAWPVGAWTATRKAKDRVVAGLEAARPLNAWIGRHVA